MDVVNDRMLSVSCLYTTYFLINFRHNMTRSIVVTLTILDEVGNVNPKILIMICDRTRGDVEKWDPGAENLLRVKKTISRDAKGVRTRRS